MNTLQRHVPTRTMPMARWAAWAVSAGAAGAGAWLGYGFGQQLGGLWLGVLAAFNGAAISSLLASAAVGSWGREDRG